MAIDRRITDLDSIGALSTGDLFLVTDADQSNIAKNATIDIVSNYIVSQVPSSARAFGGAVNEIATWAEGNNLDIIPSSKLPAAIIPDLSNLVTLDTAQHITGDKILSAGTTINSQTIVTAGNDQTILGKKTIQAPILTGITDVTIIRFPDGTSQDTAGGGGGGEVTKAAVDTAIGVSPTGDSAQFYNEQGNFIDAVYDSVEDAPIIRNATIETITIAGTRTNVQVAASGESEMSTITMLDSFNPVPTQYTTTFTSPNTTFTPSLVFPAGSQGRQLSLTELDGTVHRFCYLVNGNYRVLAGGLTGTVRVGPVAVATTATVTAAVTVPDQTAGQTITLAGDETGTFSVGDFISPQANNFGAFRGIFVDSITFDGTNTVIVGPSNGATTFNTTSVLRNAGPATEIQGTSSSYSYDPDTANSVYPSAEAVTNNPWSTPGADIQTHITRVANSITALNAAITWDGVITATLLNGEAASSVTLNLGTETNIDSSFTITGGLNNMNTLVNTDGAPGMGLTVATTVTVIDPEATEVASQTFGVTDANDNNVDAVGVFINSAVNSNTETPIDFTSQYGSGVLTLQAREAGNTNPWTIVFNNNGATAANAGNLSTSTVQSGFLVNQFSTSIITGIPFSNSASINIDGEDIQIISNSQTISTDIFFVTDVAFDTVPIAALSSGITFNATGKDYNVAIRKENTGNAYRYDGGTDVTTIDSDTINFVGNTFTGLPLPNPPTADGDYKLVIASGVATWQII